MAVFKRHNAGLINGIRGEQRVFLPGLSEFSNEFLHCETTREPLAHKRKGERENFQNFRIAHLCLDLFNPDVNMTLQGIVFCV